MKLFLFFGTEAMITLEEAVIGIPIGEAAGISIPLIAEDVDVLLVHLDGWVRRSMASAFLSITMYLELGYNHKGDSCDWRRR